MNQGKFIVFSGGEGSGKTTVINRLRDEHIIPDAVFTREPGGTPLGEALRSVLLDHRFSPVPWSELFQFMAIRAQHVEELIKPTIAAGRHVICDRYMQDSYAYQWFARMRKSMPADLFMPAHNAGFPNPDLWFWLDVDPAEGLRRRRSTEEINRLDDEDFDFHVRVREGFEHLMGFDPYVRIGRRIDANQDPETVYLDVKRQLLPFLQT